MRLTDGEKIFLNGCMEQERPGFPMIDRSAASYWEMEDTSVPPVSAYGFETPVEMEACLRPYVACESLRKILVAESFKNLAVQQGQRQADREKGETQKAQEEKIPQTVPCGDTLPAYVYNF